MDACMDPFRTIFQTPNCPRRIGIGQVILSLGSCFSEHMGTRLRENRFRICVNPTGILYNPLSIASAVRRLVSGTPYEANDLFEHSGAWRSLDHHSRFARPTQTEALDVINRELAAGHESILRAEWLLVTFGTAAAWFRRDVSGRVVANCHRLPSERFERRFLSVEEMVTCWQEALAELRAVNPGVAVLFTLSPVRYLRNDAHENLSSKSRLTVAIDTLLAAVPDTFYFPAYEIVMDDLRDYRFYAPDMIHPADTAVDYVWSRFRDAHLAESAETFINGFAPVLRALKHRVQDRESRGARGFAAKQLATVCELRRHFPEVDLGDVQETFERLAAEP